MARSSGTSPEQRAQLLRELSQDLNRTRNSAASTKFSQDTASPDTTTSSFDPENEALVSTRQFDPPDQMLPQLRASAEKYNTFGGPGSRSEPRSELDYAIDTSAIRRAFPDFTQGVTSSEDGSLSIEIGRGLKKSSSNTIAKLGKSNRSQASPTSNRDDSFDFSAPMIGNHYVTSTPPLANPKTRASSGAVQGNQSADTHNRQPSGLRNEVRDTTPPVIKTKDYVSGSSRQGSENRQTLAAMHARVRDENDVTYISEGRPPTIDLTAKSSRFSTAKNQNRDLRKGLPTRFNSQQKFTQPASSHEVDVTPAQRPISKGAPTSNPTTQSVVLPQMPNVSELLSGVFEDGTPVFTLNNKHRSSRFASGYRAQQRQISRVDNIDVPQEEQDIYLSLQIAEDKVADLERIREDAEYAIGELQERNRILEAEKAGRRRRQRSDSAIGLTDGGSDAGDEMSGGQRKLLIEKNRLESSVRLLSSQVEASGRKATVSDITLKNVTKERDSAISQLGVAYVTIEQLKSENLKLAEENQELKVRIGLEIIERKDEISNKTYKDNQYPVPDRPQASGIRNEPEAYTTRAERSAKALTATKKRHTKLPTDSKSSKLRFEERLAARGNEKAELRTETDSASKILTHDGNSRLSGRGENCPTDLFPPKEHTQRSVGFEENEASGSSEVEQIGETAIPGYPQKSSSLPGDQAQNKPRDITYMSFLEDDEVLKLRRRLEYERRERKQQEASKGARSRSRDNTARTEVHEQSQHHNLPRKSSLKTSTRRFTDPVDTADRSIAVSEALSTQESPSKHSRRHSETSVDAKWQRREQAKDSMTSAFILPDITLREAAPELSPAGEKVLEDLKNHNSQNCTVCHQAIEPNSSHHHAGAAKQTIKIPKPIPVSERMPEPSDHNDDPTIRPSQPPALALASVLKGLEDEIAHQKIQLVHYQKLYNGHDPALSKRQRKSICAKIEALLKAIDMKADQIYSLYDVLEGQKQDGHEITEKEVEVTLQSIGVDVADLGLRGGDLNDPLEHEPADRHPWDLDSNDGTEDELPWEGIDSTAGTRKSTHELERRRRSSAA